MFAALVSAVSLPLGAAMTYIPIESQVYNTARTWIQTLGTGAGIIAIVQSVAVSGSAGERAIKAACGVVGLVGNPVVVVCAAYGNAPQWRPYRD